MTEEAKAEQTTEDTQNVSFSDAVSSNVANWSSVSDPTFDVASSDSIPLGDWFSRPIQIGFYNWSSTGFNTTVFNPWVDYITNESVNRKLRNWAFLRGNLHLKFVINGSPFYYGRMITAYAPYSPYNESLASLTVNNVGTGSTVPNGTNPTINFLSQLQCEYLDPSTSHSVEMSLPFISPKNWCRLYREGTGDVNAYSQLADFQAMGTVTMMLINELRQGNTPEPTANLSVDITVFAWMDDVKLAVPTNTALTTEPPVFKAEGKITKTKGKSVSMGTGNKKELKEATEGKTTISGVASAFASSFSALSQVPVIGPFATAGSVAASSISSIAKIFGFSKPMQTADTMRYFPEPMHNTASTVGAFTGYKLAVDPMNEVTLDPRVGNLPPEDEMTIQSIARREAFLTSVVWTEQNRPITGEATLFRCAVAPWLHSVAQNTTTDEIIYQPTPMAFACTPFQAWRGTLKVRMQLVASQYHRGRIAIFYEPNIRTQELFTSPGELEYSTRFVEIFDLEEIDGACVEFPWASPRPFCTLNDIENQFSDNTVPYSPSGLGLTATTIMLGLDANTCNGYFEIRVVNELASAVPDAPPIEINLFVSMEDLEVAYPRNINNSVLARTPGISPTRAAPVFKAEGDAKVTEGFTQEDPSTDCHYLMDQSNDSDLFKVFFGENVRSFRTLLKRPQAILYPNDTPVTGNSVAVLNSALYPRGGIFSRSPITGVLEPNEVVLFDYLRYAYIGMRGSMRYYLSPVSQSMSMTSLDMGIGAMTTEVKPDFNAFQSNLVGPTYGANAVTSSRTNSCLTAEVPYYSSNRFFFAFNGEGLTGTQWSGNDVIDDDGIFSDDRFPQLRTRVSREGNDLAEFAVAISAATGEDFSFIGYQAPPPRYLPRIR